MAKTTPKPTLFDYEITPNGFVARVLEPQLSGEIKAEILKIELGRLIDLGNPQVVILDLSDVKVISSVVIGAMVQLHKKLASIHSELRQCCLPSVIKSVYQTAGLDGQVFATFDTVEAALAASTESLRSVDRRWH